MNVYIITKWKIIKVCIVFLLVVSSVLLSKPYVVDVFNNVSKNEERKLPIYCVETSEKNIAISFDAAWGAAL